MYVYFDIDEVRWDVNVGTFGHSKLLACIHPWSRVMCDKLQEVPEKRPDLWKWHLDLHFTSLHHFFPQHVTPFLPKSCKVPEHSWARNKQPSGSHEYWKCLSLSPSPAKLGAVLILWPRGACKSIKSIYSNCSWQSGASSPSKLILQPWL